MHSNATAENECWTGTRLHSQSNSPATINFPHVLIQTLRWLATALKVKCMLASTLGSHSSCKTRPLQGSVSSHSPPGSNHWDLVLAPQASRVPPTARHFLCLQCSLVLGMPMLIFGSSSNAHIQRCIPQQSFLSEQN